MAETSLNGRRCPLCRRVSMMDRVDNHSMWCRACESLMPYVWVFGTLISKQPFADGYLTRKELESRRPARMLHQSMAAHVWAGKAKRDASGRFLKQKTGDDAPV